MPHVLRGILRLGAEGIYGRLVSDNRPRTSKELRGTSYGGAHIATAVRVHPDMSVWGQVHV